MIDRNEVIKFFDKIAPVWDAEMIRSDEKINTILSNAHVCEKCRVLDVACGTGVLIPDYLARNVGSVDAIDISPEMIRIAKEKFHSDNIRFICADAESDETDAESLEAENGYDCIVVYNAFPHFEDGERLIRHLTSLLKKGGYLTVAHGMSRADIDNCHNGNATAVSNCLIPVSELSNIFSQVMEVTTVISDENMYQVVGRRRD